MRSTVHCILHNASTSTYAMARLPSKHKALGAVFKATHASSDLGKKAMYMGVHLAFGTATMALALLYWFSFLAHTLFVLSIALASVWNASGYYFNHFARKYEEGLSSQVAKVVAPPPAKAASTSQPAALL